MAETHSPLKCQVEACQRTAQPLASNGMCRVCQDRFLRAGRTARAAGREVPLQQFLRMPVPRSPGRRRPQAASAQTPAVAGNGSGANAGGAAPVAAAAATPDAPLDARFAAYILRHMNWDRVAAGVQMQIAVLLLEAAQ